MIRKTLLFLTFSALLFTSSPVISTSNKILGADAPPFTLTDINGTIFSLKNWRGKIVILNFWATWCKPCQKEIPLFNSLQAEYAEDVQFVGVAIDNIKNINTFMKSIPIDYVNLVGGIEATKMVVNYGNKAGVLPYTVIINQSGKVVSVMTGLLTKTVLVKQLEKHLQ